MSCRTPADQQLSRPDEPATSLAILIRNFLNSAARCRRCRAADAAYGREWRLRRMLEDAGLRYVLAVPKSQQVPRFGRIDCLFAQAPDEAWEMLRAVTARRARADRQRRPRRRCARWPGVGDVNDAGDKLTAHGTRGPSVGGCAPGQARCQVRHLGARAFDGVVVVCSDGAGRSWRGVKPSPCPSAGFGQNSMFQIWFQFSRQQL